MSLVNPLTDIATSAVREQVRNLLAEIAPERVRAYDEAGAIPNEFIRLLGTSGILGMAADETSRAQWVAVVEELGRIDAALRTFVTVQCDLVMRSIVSQGNEEQKARWLQPLINGEIRGSFTLTEPNAGSDAGSIATLAGGDPVHLMGNKAWATNGSTAKIAVVFARDDSNKISAYLVELPQKEWVAVKVPGLLGMRSLDSVDVALNGVRAELLGAPGGGWRIAMNRVDDGRLGVAAGSVGLAQASLEAAIRYAHQRNQFGKAIANFQLVQALIADIAVDVIASRQMVAHAADAFDRGDRASTLISAAKLFATQAAERSATASLQVHGSHGYSSKYPVERYFRDARAATLYQGTSEIQKLILGRDILGTNAIA